jgi:hypothetical protein
MLVLRMERVTDEFRRRLPAIVEELSRTSGAGRPIKAIES